FLNENGTAMAATGAPIPVRFGTWYWGLGHTPNHAIKPVSQTGAGIEFLEECASLQEHVPYLNHYSGFNMPLDGRSNYTHFTGWVASRTGSAPSSNNDIPAPTLDLLVGDAISGNTRFRTLDVTAVGIARENYSARSTNSRAAAEASPERLYARVFGADFADPNKADFKPDPNAPLRLEPLDKRGAVLIRKDGGQGLSGNVPPESPRLIRPADRPWNAGSEKELKTPEDSRPVRIAERPGTAPDSSRPAEPQERRIRKTYPSFDRFDRGDSGKRESLTDLLRDKFYRVFQGEERKADSPSSKSGSVSGRRSSPRSSEGSASRSSGRSSSPSRSSSPPKSSSGNSSSGSSGNVKKK
ncbi:MAG TPA: DUF1552 domain-containing protein, partial [Candidatus Aminicenantes bacterium]|nr:DUF1552 domain-containing protein [Candidatus Aminicenantes bacterium]